MGVVNQQVLVSVRSFFHLYLSLRPRSQATGQPVASGLCLPPQLNDTDGHCISKYCAGHKVFKNPGVSRQILAAFFRDPWGEYGKGPEDLSLPKSLYYRTIHANSTAPHAPAKGEGKFLGRDRTGNKQAPQIPPHSLYPARLCVANRLRTSPGPLPIAQPTSGGTIRFSFFSRITFHRF